MIRKYIRNDKLIIKKFYSYLILGIIIVFALQFGSLADGIVVGNFLGSEALTATSLSLPVIYFVEIVGFGLSVGGPIVIGNLLGKRETEKASKVMSFTLIFGFLVTLIFVPIGIFLSDHIANLLSGNFKELNPLISLYIKAYLFQAPILTVGLCFSGIIGADNNPKLSALYYIVANVVHIGVEILFCLFAAEEMRIFWAGLSTGIGFLAGLIVIIPYKFSKTRTLKFSLKNLAVRGYFTEVINSSTPGMLNIFLLFIMNLVMNIASTFFLTSASDLTIYAMMANSVFIVDLVVTGVLQLLPQVVGTLYGEKDYISIRAICKRILLISEIVAVALTAIVASFPQLFFYIFGVSLEGIGEAELLAVRIYAISFIFYCLNKFILSYYPSIGVNKITNVNLLTRNLIVGAPLLFVLIMLNGIMGYAYGTIIIEAVSVLVSFVFAFILYKKDKVEGKPILLLPEIREDADYIECSASGTSENISEMLEELRVKLESEYHISSLLSAYISIAIEEVTTNMNRFSSKSNHKPSMIDISIKKNGDKVIVRIRDNNVSFDPTYKPENDEYGLEGLSIIKKVSREITYLRLLNLNNTIIEFNNMEA